MEESFLVDHNRNSCCNFIFYISPQIGTRFVNTFIEQLPTNVESPYLRVWNGGIDAFQTAPVIGIGPDNYRKMCAEISRSFTDVVVTLIH